MNQELYVYILLFNYQVVLGVDVLYELLQLKLLGNLLNMIQDMCSNLL